MKHALMYTKKLESAGLTREQAQAHLEILEEIVDGDMATKADLQNSKNEVLTALGDFKSEVHKTLQEFRNELQELRMEMDARFQEIRNEIQELRVEMDSRFQEFRAEMDTRFQEVWTEIRLIRSDMKMMEQRIVRKMGVMITAAVCFMSALFTLVH